MMQESTRASADPLPPGDETVTRDVMSREKRSAFMSRIRGKDTGPERMLAALFRSHRFKFEQHVRELPGRPDFVFRTRRLVVLVDGDFWHGWRFPLWAHKLSPFWCTKIASNRARDARNMRKLRRAGWKVVRVWEHQLETNPARVFDGLLETLRSLQTSRLPREQ
jgi:DNA mismatch endonuclease, patch repair protein